MRHRLLGIARACCFQSVRAAAGAQSGPRRSPRIEKAKAVGAKTPARERIHRRARGLIYTDYDKLDHRTRLRTLPRGDAGARRSATRQDDEAQILLRPGARRGHLAADKNYTNQLKAGAILEPCSSTTRIIRASPTI